MHNKEPAFYCVGVETIFTKIKIQNFRIFLEKYFLDRVPPMKMADFGVLKKIPRETPRHSEPETCAKRFVSVRRNILPQDFPGL